MSPILDTPTPPCNSLWAPKAGRANKPTCPDWCKHNSRANVAQLGGPLCGARLHLALAHALLLPGAQTEQAGGLHDPKDPTRLASSTCRQAHGRLPAPRQRRAPYRPAAIHMRMRAVLALASHAPSHTLCSDAEATRGPCPIMRTKHRLHPCSAAQLKAPWLRQQHILARQASISQPPCTILSAVCVEGQDRGSTPHKGDGHLAATWPRCSQAI